MVRHEVRCWKNVFPTHVGMNRPRARSVDLQSSVPHARGDEPKTVRVLLSAQPVFPTHVGMNRA